MAAPNETNSLYRTLETLFRHKAKVVLIPTIVLGLGLAIALFAPRSYRSEAKLALRVGRQSVNMDPTASTGQKTIAIQQVGREGEVMTAMDLLRSRGVIAKAVDRIGVEYAQRGGPPGEGQADPMTDVFDATVGAALNWAITTIKSIDPISDREDAIIRVEKNLVVDAERDSTLIVVTYSTKSPEGAQRMLETLIEVYREEHLRVHRNAGSREFFTEQEQLFRGRLDSAMDAVRVAKDEIGVASIETRRQHLESQLQEITMATYQAEAARSAEAAELSDLRRQVNELPERLIASKKSIPNEGADLLRDQLYALQVRRADLKARYSSEHPLVMAISRQLDEASKVLADQQEVRQETTDDVNPIHRELSLAINQKQSSIASLEARLAALQQQEAVVRRDLEKLNKDSVRLAQLERDQEILRRDYMRYSDNLEQARIDEELERQKISSVSLAQPPTLAEKPVSPSKLFVALGSMVLAFAGTAATVMGLEQLSDKLRTDRSIEQATGLPVLAAIPDSAVHGRVLAP